MTIFQAINVNKIYESKARRTKALSNVNISVDNNEFVSIVGPSGCGKTTFLNLVAGFDLPSSGKCFFKENEISGPDPERCMIFQDYALFPWLTARENIEFGLHILGEPESKRRFTAETLLEKISLAGFENAYPHELSGGMKQRVAFARSLAMQPDLLLMDEPFGAIDAITRLSLQDMLARTWQDAKMSILFVTHNIEEAVYLSDRVIVFTNRPAEVAAEIKINILRPRNRFSPDVAGMREKLHALLKYHCGI